MCSGKFVYSEEFLDTQADGIHNWLFNPLAVTPIYGGSGKVKSGL